MRTPFPWLASLPPKRCAEPFWARLGALAAIFSALAACTQPAATPSARTSAPAVPAAPSATPPPPPAPGRSDPSCAAPLDAPTARVTLRAARGQLVIGLLAGLKDAGDENLAHLRRLVAQLRSRGAELLIVDGDLGDNSESQEALLSALAPMGQALAPGAAPSTAAPAAAPIPLLINAGNREVRTELDAAEAALRKKGVALIDLSHTRVIDLGDALIVGLPGAFERRLLRTEGACIYAQADLDALGTFFDKLPPNAPPAILVAAVPPRGDGMHGLDFSDGQNVGDARLAPLLTATRARFGLFAQVWEAGGHAIDGQGQPVAGALLSNQLYVNPGAADRTAWPMNDGTTATGLAALITVRGAKASYEPIRELPATARP